MKTEKMVNYFKEKGFEVKKRVVHSGVYFTLAEARLAKGKKIILYSEGIARRSHSQEMDKNIGNELATTRAVSALWKKYHRQGKNKVVHHWSAA